jgi:ABC-type Fe3+/spermidine/putrescine transport system ATPase subunit
MLADSIAVIDRGAIVQVGSPAEILDRPCSRFVATFVGYGNFFNGIVAGTDGGTVRVRLAGGDMVALRSCSTAPALGAAVTIAVRSDRIELDAENEHDNAAVHLTGRVRRVQNLGRWREIHVDYADVTLSVREPSDATPSVKPEQCVSIRFPSDSPLLLA